MTLQDIPDYSKKNIHGVKALDRNFILGQFAEIEKELNWVSDTILYRINPIVDIFGSIEGLEEFLMQFKSKKIKKITDEDVEDLRKQLLEAKKRGEADFAQRFEMFMSAISVTENMPKKHDKTD